MLLRMYFFCAKPMNHLQLLVIIFLVAVVLLSFVNVSEGYTKKTVWKTATVRQGRGIRVMRQLVVGKVKRNTYAVNTNLPPKTILGLKWGTKTAFARVYATKNTPDIILHGPTAQAFPDLLAAGKVQYRVIQPATNVTQKKTIAITGGRPTSGGKKTLITFYGQNKADDNGAGLSGVDLFRYGDAGVTFNGQPVYPGAVHAKHGNIYMYKVLQVSAPGLNTVLIHVVDVCDAADGACNNVKKVGFLVDVHKTGFQAIGAGDGEYVGSFKVVGEIRPSQLPESVWPDKVTNGGDYIMCSCTTPCDDPHQNWMPLNQCT